MNKPKTKIISISMPEDEVERLHQLARAFKISSSKLIREAIKLWEKEENDVKRLADVCENDSEVYELVEELELENVF